VLKHDRKAVSGLGQDLRNTRLEERETVGCQIHPQQLFISPVLATRLSTIEEVNRPTRLVIRRVGPEPLAESAVHALLEVRPKLREAVRLVLGLGLG
jgi:hypothetical protein